MASKGIMLLKPIWLLICNPVISGFECSDELWPLQVTQVSASPASAATSSRSELQALREEQARMKAEYDRMEVSSV